MADPDPASAHRLAVTTGVGFDVDTTNDLIVGIKDRIGECGTRLELVEVSDEVDQIVVQ